MAATKDDIRRWLQYGLELKPSPTHMIVVCDTFDWEDYPVYVCAHEDVRTKHEQYNHSNMTKVMEVYSYALSFEEQLKESRSFNFD